MCWPRRRWRWSLLQDFTASSSWCRLPRHRSGTTGIRTTLAGMSASSSSCLQYTLGDTGIVAIAICAAAAPFGRLTAPRSAASRFAIDPISALLVGVPVLVLLGAIVSSTLLAPNFFDRNFLVLSPFFWGISARLYDAATIAARPFVRVAVNAALSIIVLSMAPMLAQRLPSERPTVLYEPFRELAEWVRSVPECRGQVIPVITTDRVAWYKPGFAESLYGTIYGHYLQGFARPQLLFMEEIAEHHVDADLRRELRRRLDGEGCPILAWSVHNMPAASFARVKRDLLQSTGGTPPDHTMRTREFRQGQEGYALYLDR